MRASSLPAAAPLSAALMFLLASGPGPVRAEQAPRAAVFVVPAQGEMESDRREALRVTMESALTAGGKVELVDLDQRLADRAGLIPTAAVSEAIGLLESGRALLGKDRLRPALTRLEAALEQLEKSLSHIPLTRLAEAQFLIGAAQSRLGRAKAARATLSDLLIWRPGHAGDKGLAGSRAQALLEKIRAEHRKRPRRSLVVVSEPDGARAFVDGELAGLTPVIAPDLPTGRHYVVIKKPGYQRAVLAADVSVNESARAEAVLEPSPGFSRITELAGQLGEDLGAAKVGPALDELRALLDIDHAVFVRAPATGEGEERYQGFVYDARRRRLLTRAESALRGDVEQAFAELSRALYTFLEAKPEEEEPLRATAQKSGERRAPGITDKWWFWAGVGAIAATAISVPLVLSSDGGCPGDAVCGGVVVDF